MYRSEPSAEVLQRLPLRAFALIGLVVVSYHHSLLSLTRGLTHQTPLAYLGLVPIVAFGLGWLAVRRAPAVRPIHDRQVDYIVGLAFICAAASLALLIPMTLSSRFWIYRIDLLSLPLFVAGAICLLYGVRRLWTLRFAVAFLLLAWPVPYLPIVGDGMRASVDITVALLARLTDLLPLATPINDGAEGIFAIHHGGQFFLVSVGTACSGVNSLVGFGLIGSALTAVIHGPIVRRAAWLLAGLALVWVLNVVRIETIFVVGAIYGEAAALDVLHPVAGLVLFNLLVVGMLLALPAFGLSLREPDPAATAATGGAREVAGGRIGRSVMVGGLVALLFASLNASYARYEPLTNGVGGAALVAFDTTTPHVPDWDVHFVNAYEHARPFFGEDSTWERFRYVPQADAALSSSQPLFVDVVRTADPGALAAYGLEACYSFHGYRIDGRASIELPAGVTGELIDFVNPRVDGVWSVLAWEWPYRARDESTRYERIVLLLRDGPTAALRGESAEEIAGTSESLVQTERFLATFARQVIADHLQTSAAAERTS
jgi:exosortase/archaeosortase family protein